MLKPTERPPDCCAPRFAASITPGPPPVTTANPFSDEAGRRLDGERAPAICLGQPGGAEDRDGRPVDARDRLEPGPELLGDPGDVAVDIVGLPLQHRPVVHVVTVSAP